MINKYNTYLHLLSTDIIQQILKRRLLRDLNKQINFY